MKKSGIDEMQIKTARKKSLAQGQTNAHHDLRARIVDTLIVQSKKMCVHVFRWVRWTTPADNT